MRDTILDPVLNALFCFLLTESFTLRSSGQLSPTSKLKPISGLTLYNSCSERFKKP